MSIVEVPQYRRERMLDEALARIIDQRFEPAAERTAEFQHVMYLYMSKLLTVLWNDTYFGSLLNVGKGDQLMLYESAPERFEVKIVLKNLWRLVCLNLEIRLADGGTVSLEPKRARDIEAKMVLARVLHPLYDVIRPVDVMVLFAAAVSTAVPKVTFGHPAMSAPHVVMSNGSVTLLVEFRGRPMRLELIPVFQFPWAFLPKELKDSGRLAAHAKTENFNWLAVPQKDSNQITWAIQCSRLEHEFREKNNLNPLIRLVQGMSSNLPQRLVTQACLWLGEERGASFWSSGLGHVFVEVVDYLCRAHLHSKLSDFWVAGHELLGADSQATADRLQAALEVLRSPDATQATVSALFQ